MRSFDARAIANIATAPATSADRRAAVAMAGALIGLFVVSVPFGRLRLGEAQAFLPTVVGASIVALLITAVILYVQYRIERDAKLAFVAIAYAFAAGAQSMYLLTFPRVFAPHGLFGAGSQTAIWWYLAGQAGFTAFLAAQAVDARTTRSISRDGVRAIALGTAAGFVVLGVIFSTYGDTLPALIADDDTFTRLWYGYTAPILALAMVAVAALCAGRFFTVVQIWLPIVLLTRALDIAASIVGGARFSFGWYESRTDTVIGAVVVFAVFLVKINDLMLRLAARSRSTAEALAVGEARYASLANVIPQLIWTTNPSGDVEYVNDRWVAYTGFDLAHSRDGGWREAFHPDHEPALLNRLRHSLRTGEPLAAEYRMRERATGRYRWFLLNAVPARDQRGEIVAWIGTCTDVDAQKRLEERDAFLARAGERLGASLDVSATVSAMRALLVPRLAERTWIALLDDDGRYVLSGVGSVHVGDELDARRWIGLALSHALHDAVAPIVAAGDPIVLEKPDRFPDPWASEVPAGAAMVVPLVVGDAALGVVTLLRENGRAYDVDDVAIVRELARRAALSLEHARLYERERATADALQRAMLPAQLPQLPDMSFSASYSAASESQRVGGDFYDAFELPDGRVALTIGDVTGQGLEAAVIMGEVRQALRASSFESTDPSVILDRASRLLVASGRTVFVTAIFGVLDPVTGRFAYATAGHPPPLIDQENMLRRLPSAGLPIGLRDDQGVDFAVRLKAPCTLVMFTDGLLEFGRDIAEGERRIEVAIRTLAREEIDHLATALMKNVLGEDEPTDDIAILTVTVDRFGAVLPGDEREWRFSSEDGRTATMVRHEIGPLIAAWTQRPELQFAGELAFGELIANAVRHAPGPVRVLAITNGDGAATLMLEDSGPGFADNPHHTDAFTERGRGLEVVRGISDGLRIDPAPRGGSRATVMFRPVTQRA